MQGWERAINTLSVRRPQPHNTNPQNERRERENRCTQLGLLTYERHTLNTRHCEFDLHKIRNRK